MPARSFSMNLFEVMAGEVRVMIGHEIKEAGMFFLMFDESKYSADHEQISVCVR